MILRSHFNLLFSHTIKLNVIVVCMSITYITVVYDPCIVAHTRTSLLRTLNSNINTEWLLPETRALFEQQWKRQLNAAGKYFNFAQHFTFKFTLWNIV